MSRRRSHWFGIGTAAGMKVVVMGATGLLGLVTSRVILANFGVEAYAQYGLLASLPALLPFADLGIAAVVINAAAEAEDPRSDDRMLRALTSAVRVLFISGAVIVVVAVALTVFDLWPAVLGPGLMPGASWVAGLCLALFGLGLPLTVGPRLLVGLGRNTTQIATQAVVAPTILALVGLCVLLSLDAAEYLAVFTYIAGVFVSTICLVIAARLVAPQLGKVFRAAPHPRRHPGVRVMNLAWPMLVQMLALPIAMQSARILISQLGGVQQLAEYNLASQLFGIALQTIAAAGVALWPIYARARSARRIESPFAPTLWFLLGGLVLAGAMAVLSPWLASLASDGELALPLDLVLAFVIFVALQAAKYPIGMYMTDLAGLRFQVIPTIVMVPLSLGLSWWLIPDLGATGSVLAVSAAVALCQVIPNLVYVGLDLRRRRAQADSSARAETDGASAREPRSPRQGSKTQR